MTPREHQARCPARPRPCCGSGLASPGPHEQSCGSGGGFRGARLPGRAGTGLSQPRHVPPGMGCVRGLGAAGGVVGSGWGALGRGRCLCQNRLSREHPWGCGRDVRPLPQMWDCKTGVLLQVHLLNPRKHSGCRDGVTSKAPDHGLAPPQHTPDHLPSPSPKPHRPFPRALLPPPPSPFLLAQDLITRVTWRWALLGTGQCPCWAWVSATAKGRGHPQLPLCTVQALTEVGPRHSPMTGPSFCRARALQPSPSRHPGNTSWAVQDAAPAPARPGTPRLDFHTLPALLPCLQAGNPNHCSRVRRLLPAQLHLEPSPPLS